jgi:hypothetical protein
VVLVVAVLVQSLPENPFLKHLLEDKGNLEKPKKWTEKRKTMCV